MTWYLETAPYKHEGLCGIIKISPSASQI